ncbi:MAG: CocE/NonD family hydrolase [Myxococcota bacterium]
MVWLSWLGCARYEVSAPWVTAEDGTRLAVDVILPDDREGPSPVVLISTRYWRSFDLKFDRSDRAMPIGPREDIAAELSRAGYGVVIADLRGTGASEGTWERPWSDDEVADLGALVDWIAAQPWCDGRVGATGVSYEGTTALLAATHGHPALRAVLAREIEWDLVDELLAPGGVRNVAFVDVWGRSAAALDRGEVPELFPKSSRWMIEGPRPTDDDPDGVARDARIAARVIADVAADVEHVRAPADPWGEGGPPASTIGPSAWVDALVASDAALGVWGSWWDGATADAVLRADAALGLVDARVGGWTHEGTDSASPLADRDRAARLSLDDVVGFFDTHLRGDGGPPLRRWYVAGPEVWEEGAQWPVVVPRSYSPRQDGALGAPDPNLRRALEVDFDATVGPESRWSAGLLTAVPAPNRDDAPGLLSFATPPFDAPVQLFGEAELRCAVEIDGEAALHVYVEAVEPSGKVRLLTEGVTRARTGVVTVRIRPVSARLEAGWALRLSVAGADADTFERVPASGPQRITLVGDSCALELGTAR